jgi:hypothetical protein
MGYQQIDTNLTFAEISLMRSMEHNRSLRIMEKNHRLCKPLRVLPQMGLYQVV